MSSKFSVRSVRRVIIRPRASSVPYLQSTGAGGAAIKFLPSFPFMGSSKPTVRLARCILSGSWREFVPYVLVPDRISNRLPIPITGRAQPGALLQASLHHS